MAEEKNERFYQEGRKYLEEICREGYARGLDPEKTEECIQNALCKAGQTTQPDSHYLEDSDGLTEKTRKLFDDVFGDTLSHELNEHELFILIKRRDESPQAKEVSNKAYAVLYSNHYKSLLQSTRHCSRDILSEEEAKEITQETLLRIAYEKAHEFKPYENNINNPEMLHWQVHTWLSVCARNKVNDIRRTRKSVRIINAGDIKAASDRAEAEGRELEDEEKLDAAYCASAGADKLRKEAEERYYPEPESTEPDESSEKIKRIIATARTVLTGRDLEVFLTGYDYYDHPSDRVRAMKEVAERLGINIDHTRKIISRAHEKIRKKMNLEDQASN